MFKKGRGEEKGKRNAKERERERKIDGNKPRITRKKERESN